MAGRGKSTALDMVRSLAVIGIAVALMFAFSTQQTPQFSVPTSDVTATVDAAHKNVDFPVLWVPTLPAGWSANAAYLDPIPGTDDRWTFHLGYVSDKNLYFGVDASNTADLEAFTGGYLFGVDAGETRTVAGLEFTLYKNEKQRLLLYKGTAAHPYAIILTASGDDADLVQFLQLLAKR